MRLRHPALIVVGCLAAALIAARPLLAPSNAPPMDPPKPPEPEPDPQDAPWAPLQDAPGLAVRLAERAYTTPPVAARLRYGGLVAQHYGGALQVADISGPAQGAEFPPHKSHRTGRDADVAYTLAAYPTPPEVAATYGFAQVLQALRPWTEKVFVSPPRKAQLESLAATYELAMPPLVAIDGHNKHAHIRFIA